MRTREALRTLLQAFVFGGVAFAIFALTLRIWGVDVGNGAVAGRLGAESSFLSLYHPNNIALYLVLALVFVPGIFAEAIHNYRAGAHKALAILVSKEVSLLIGALVMALAIWLTFSRGALVALCIGVAVALVVLAIWSRGLLRVLSIGIIGIGLIGLGGLVIVGGPGLLGRYASLLNPLALSSDPDVAQRLDLYTRALKVISEHPITGIGLQQFATTGSIPFSPPNTYLAIWVSTGLYGMLAFIIVLLLGLGAACAEIYRLSRTRNIVDLLYMLGFAIALVAFAAQAFVESYDTNERIAPVAWMLALCLDGTLLSLSSRWKRTPKSTSAEAVQPEVVEAEGARRVAGADERPIKPARPRRPSPSVPLGDWENEWKEDTAAVPIWNLRTTALPAWQLHTEGADPWQVETLQLRALGADISSARTTRLNPAQQPLGGSAAQEEPKQAAPSADSKSSNDAGEELLRRAPTSFLWNQMYALWYFATSFLLSIVITRGLNNVDFGIYTVLTTIIGTITFICAIGLEDTATVFLPRILTRDGSAATGTLIRRLLVTRVLIIGIVGLGIAVGLIVAAPYLVHFGILYQATSRSPGFRALFIALFLTGTSISTLQSAFFSALLKSRAVLIIGGLSQVASVAGVVILVKSGWGVDGVIAALAVVDWLTVLAYLGPLSSLIFARGKITSVGKGEMRKLMVGSWLANITNGALGKQMDVLIMTAFTVSLVAIGNYNLAYQLGGIVGVVLISGLGGVGVAAMSAALATGGNGRLASMWRANMMLQLLLATPLQIICIVFADQIVSVLYGPRYLGATLLLRVILGFSILGRLTGGGASQAALYVMGRQRSVVVMRWSGLIINVILDITLIQVYGPLGAMVATGFSQLWVNLMEFLLLRGYLGITYPIAFAARVVSVSVFACLLLTWWTPPGIYGLVAEFSVFGVLFAIGLWILRSGESNDLAEMMFANPRLKALVARLNKFIPRRRREPAPISA